MAHTADAVVIGAGVIGCSVAYELARSGRTVTVVDRGPGAGHGSTSASSAIIRFHYSTRDGVATSWESKHCWEKWSDHLGGDDELGMVRFIRTGGIVIDAPPMNVGRVEGLFDDIGVPYEVWDAATIRARAPQVDPARFGPPKPVDDDAFWAEPEGEIRALYTPDAGFIDDPQLAAHNLMAAAQRRGAMFHFNTAVREITRSADRVRGVVLADGSAIDAPVVVNVAGPHSSVINQLAGVLDDFTISTRPLRQEVHHVAAPAGYGEGECPGPFVSDPDLGVYFRGAPGQGLLVGGSEPECDPLVWLDDADDYNPNPTLSAFEAQTTRTARRLPELRVPGAPRGIAGVYDVADDWTPIYDRTLLPGFYVAIGTSGNQFKNAPLAGRFLAAIVRACEDGHDHDAEPVQYVGEHTGQAINLGSFSRKRPLNSDSSFSVMG